MTFRSYGRVTVAVPTVIQRLSAVGRNAHTVIITALPANAGRIYIGTADMVVATGVGVLAILGIPPVATGPIPAVQFTAENMPTGIGVGELWIDATNGTDGVVVGAIQG